MGIFQVGIFPTFQNLSWHSLRASKPPGPARFLSFVINSLLINDQLTINEPPFISALPAGTAHLTRPRHVTTLWAWLPQPISAAFSPEAPPQNRAVLIGRRRSRGKPGRGPSRRSPAAAPVPAGPEAVPERPRGFGAAPSALPVLPEPPGLWHLRPAPPRLALPGAVVAAAPPRRAFLLAGALPPARSHWLRGARAGPRRGPSVLPPLPRAGVPPPGRPWAQVRSGPGFPGIPGITGMVGMMGIMAAGEKEGQREGSGIGRRWRGWACSGRLGVAARAWDEGMGALGIWDLGIRAGNAGMWAGEMWSAAIGAVGLGNLASGIREYGLWNWWNSLRSFLGIPGFSWQSEDFPGILRFFLGISGFFQGF